MVPTASGAMTDIIATCNNICLPDHAAGNNIVSATTASTAYIGADARAIAPRREDQERGACCPHELGAGIAPGAVIAIASGKRDAGMAVDGGGASQQTSKNHSTLDAIIAAPRESAIPVPSRLEREWHRPRRARIGKEMPDLCKIYRVADTSTACFSGNLPMAIARESHPSIDVEFIGAIQERK
jgi:hypothetical protein